MIIIILSFGHTQLKVTRQQRAGHGEELEHAIIVHVLYAAATLCHKCMPLLPGMGVAPVHVAFPLA